MYHGGPAAACCSFSRNSSAFGPTGSATVIYSNAQYTRVAVLTIDVKKRFLRFFMLK